MFLANIELPNPVMVVVSRAYVGYQNTVPDGVTFTKVKRYPPGEVNGYAQERAIIRLNFADIPPVDMANFEAAFAAAEQAYVTLTLAGLGLWLQLDINQYVTDSAWVTVAPGTGFAPEIEQGFTNAVATGAMDGPYLHSFTISLLTGDYLYSNGN